MCEREIIIDKKDTLTIPKMEISNDSGYWWETLCFDAPALFSEQFLPVAYVIHLEKYEERYTRLLKELQRYPVTQDIHVLWNRGYTNSRKHPRITTPSLDIIDCYHYIMNDAQTRYPDRHILIFEDDMFFSRHFDDMTAVHIIQEFLDHHSRRLFHLLFRNDSIDRHADSFLS